LPHRIILAFLIVVSLLSTACSPASRGGRPTVPEGAGSRPLGAGAVASAEKAATEAGLAILRAGGGAVDAAVAVALALAVVQPQAGNLGGGGFAVVRWEGEVFAIDFRETAPTAARRDMFLAADGSPRPEASRIGPLAAGVPGSPAGLHELHRRFGRLPWKMIVQPAIDLARTGFVVTPRLHEALEFARSRLARFEASARVWLPDGQPPPPGTTMRLPSLASTLESYAEQGPSGVMSGPVAAAVESAVQADGGILTAADLASYRPVWREPVRFSTYGWEIASMPLPSAGGMILGQTVLMMEQLGWGELEPGDPRREHFLAEAWRRAFADRYLLGDPATSRVDATTLLAADWISRRAAEIDPERATPSQEVRHWSGGETNIPGETTHLSVADEAGNVVALTTTLNGWFGCALLVEGAGFFLNNEMDDFAAAIDQPNLFELVQGEANAVRPGARMLSSMTPTVAWRGDEVLAIGSPGGGRIPTATARVLLHLIADRISMRQAVVHPRTHHQWQPDELRVEPDALSDAVRDELKRRGHRLREVRSLGEVHGVRVLADGTREAVADARGPGAAGVVDRVPE
jgi:gamma-glutamyltranspeptidase/glutathione hydrolase